MKLWNKLNITMYIYKLCIKSLLWDYSHITYCWSVREVHRCDEIYAISDQTNRNTENNDGNVQGNDEGTIGKVR